MSSKNKIIGFIFTTLFAFSNNLFSMDDPYRLDLSTSSHNPYVLHLSLPGPPSSGGQLSVQCSFARTRQPRPIYVTVPQEIEERLVEHQKLLKAQQNQREINAAQDLHRKILREGGEPQIINLSNGERMLVGLELKRKKEKYETPFLTPPPTTQLDQTETMPPTSQFFGFEPTSEDEYTMTPVFLTDDTREERKSSAQETQDFSLRPRSLLTCNHPMFNGPTMEYRPITTQTEESENIDSVEAAREAGVSVINQPLIATPTQPQERKNESRRGNPQRTSRKRRPGDDRTSVGHDATTPSKKPYHEEEIPATQSDTFRVEEGDIDSLATAEFDLDGDSNEETMGTKPQTIEDDEGNGSDETKNESQQRKRDGSLLDIIPTAAKRACIRAIASSAYTCADLLFNPPQSSDLISLPTSQTGPVHRTSTGNHHGNRLHYTDTPMRHSHHTDTPMRRTHYTDAPIRRSHHTDTPTINRDETPSSAQTSYPPGMPLPSDYYTEAETGDEGTYLDTEESLLPTIPEMESRIAGIAENAQNFCNQITAPTTAGGIVWPEEAVSYVQSLDGTLASALDLAHSLLRECKIYEAQVFANFAENLVHSAIRSSEVLDTVQRVMKAGERGLTGSIDGLINTLAHPIVTAKEAVKALTCASFDMYRMQEMMLNDPEALRVELSRRNREFKELIASSSADEILEGCFRFFFDFAIPDAVFSQATKFATFTRNLRTIHDAELALTNRVFNAIDSLKNLSGVQRLNHVLHRGLSPFRTALAEGYKVARFVARKPRKFARKVFGIVEDNPQLITEEGKTFGQVVKEIEQTLECNPQFSHPSMPVGRRGQRPTINSLLNFKVTKIYNREYSAHAIKRINERGITPMIIENIIQNGKVTPDKIVGRLQHYDKINNITVVTSSKSGNVITVFSGSN